MTDRQIVYSGAIPQDVDVLLTNKNTMVGFGVLMQAILGPGPWIDGLACTPTSPATMTVNIGPGSIYSQQNVDNSAYGSIAADTTDQIIKQGIVFGQTNFSCPAPSTSGFSIAYLIEASYQDVDGGAVVLPYYNASNPAVAYNGPNNTGISQNTVRKGVCVLTLKTGTAAATGTEILPAADVGAMPVAGIFVANGQTTITTANFFQLGNYITPKLPAVLAAFQSGAAIYAADTSGAANTIAISLIPSVSALTAGMKVRVKVANANTGPVVINTNTLGNVAANLQNGNAIPSGMLQANGIYEFDYDGNHWQLQMGTARVALTGNAAFYVSPTGNDSTGNGTSGNPWATGQHAVNYVLNNIDSAGFSVTINFANGSYTSPIAVTQPLVGGGQLILNGNVATPGSCSITVTNGNCITASGPGVAIAVQGFVLTTVTAGNCIQASQLAVVNIIGNMTYGPVAGSNNGHLTASAAGQINVTANYSITGGGAAHFYSNFAGLFSVASGLTITLTGTPAFTVFCNIQNISILVSIGSTFSGSATGPRYSSGTNSVIQTQGGGANYFPGNSAGSMTNGGLYL